MENLETINRKLPFIQRVSFLCICLMFLDWAGYGYYFILVPFLYLLIGYNLKKYIDNNLILLFIFSATYALIKYVNGAGFGYSTILLPIINFPVSYVIGKKIGTEYGDNIKLNLLFIFIFSMALLTIISIILDIKENGFINIVRNVQLIGSPVSDELNAATSLASRIIMLCGFIACLFMDINKLAKYTMFIAALIAIVCIVRLESRTGIILIAVVMIGSISHAFQQKKLNKSFLFLTITVIAYVISYFISNYSDEINVIARFQNDDTMSGGGRINMIKDVLSNLFTYPFGGMKLINTTYAHNLWVDTARETGLIPFILLIIIAIRQLKLAYKLNNNKYVNEDYGFIVFLLNVLCIVYMNTEPILQGVPVVFIFSCFLYGFTFGSLNHSKNLIKCQKNH